MLVASDQKNIKESLVTSKKRVEDHGEVFTSKREVNAMLDLVLQETRRIESRFLEPACGTGNFLEEVLARKLDIVTKRYGKSISEWEWYAFVAVSSIYGIDILPDNVLLCRERLFKPFKKTRTTYRAAINYVLEKNIICGDALSLKGIIFCEWSPIGYGSIQRRDYSFNELFKIEGSESDLLYKPLISVQGESAFIPTPIKDYPVTNFLKLPNAH